MNYKNWPYAGHVNYNALAQIQKTNRAKIFDPRYVRYNQAIDLTKSLAKKIKKKSKTVKEKSFFIIKNNSIKIGSNIELISSDKTKLKKAIKSMVPWRKGPFDIFGETIDSEWRSDLKWERVKKQAGSLQGKVILDIGCNNGYYLFHIAKQNPKYLLGIDPVIPYYLQYKLISQFYRPQNTEFRLLGVQDLACFNKVFDAVFCMGIIYHHPDPIGILKTIFNAMRPGGMLIIESQGINKKGSFCLFPKNKYLKLPGNWFVPSKEASENMIRRSGFQYVETFLEVELNSKEQRSTKDAPFDSLLDGLDPDNPRLSVEGYPAPWRFYVKARKVRVRR